MMMVVRRRFENEQQRLTLFVVLVVAIITCGQFVKVDAAASLDTNPCGPIPVVPHGRLKIYMNPPLNDAETGRALPPRLRINKITYSCDKGYVLQGDADVLCNEENLMFSAIPTCFANNTCGEAPEIDDGEVVWQSFSGESGFGDQASYTCNKAYRLSGSANVTCQLDGYWSPLPNCGTPATYGCGTPPTFDYGNVIAQSFGNPRKTIAGDYVAYGCSDGYMRTGPQILRCDGEKWRPDPPECIPWPSAGCGPAPWVENAQITTRSFVNKSSDANDYVIFACNSGYSSADDLTVACGEGGHWSTMPECSKIKACDYPPLLRHGRVYTKTYTTFPIPDSSVTYTCFNGYKMVGNAAITCSRNLTWTQLGVCTESPNYFCPAILPVQNGSIDMTTYTPGGSAKPGDAVTFKCNDGFRMFGPKIVRCLISLRWSARPLCLPPPTLKPPLRQISTTTEALTTSLAPASSSSLFCEKPPNYPHAVIVAISFGGNRAKPGDMAVYQCDNGYQRAKGSSTSLLCVQNGWLGTIKCEPTENSCISPLHLENALVVSRSFSGNRGMTKDTVTYTCNPGYYPANTKNVADMPSGAKSVTATCADGDWINLPICLSYDKLQNRRECSGGPPDLRKATIIGTGYTSSADTGRYLAGDFSIYQCGENMTLASVMPKSAFVIEDDERAMAPISSVTCLDSGVWSDAPICIPKPPPTSSCGPVPVMAQNVVVLTAEGLVGDPPSKKLYSQVNDYLQLDCTQNFELNGPDKVICQEDGTWSQGPSCTAITCGPLPASPNHGIVLFQSFQNMSTIGDFILYKCLSGYRLADADRLKCEPTGLWSSPAPACVRVVPARSDPYPNVECDTPPPLPVESSIIYSSFANNMDGIAKAGDFIVYGCPPGYSVSGNTTTTCRPGGIWSRPPPCTAGGGGNGEYRGGILRGPRCLKGLPDQTHTSCLDDSYDLITIKPVNVQSILDEHNFYRMNVTPAAKVMRNVTWDDELALTAERWAAQCTTSNDDGRQRGVPQKGWRWVGQNIFASANEVSVKQAISSWADERRYWAFGTGATDPGQVVGHYTQIIWAQTLYIGCGMAKCDSTRITMPNIFVCNYAPGGNTAYVGQNPYALPYEPASTSAVRPASKTST